MADMKLEFQKLGGQALEVLGGFVRFFTVKRVLTLLIVGLALAVVCGPRDNGSITAEPEACDSSCPLPEKAPAPEPPPIHTEVMTQENWSLTVFGDGWTPRELPGPDIKVAIENHNFMCMVFVVKEETTDSYGAYVLSTLRGFAQMGAIINSINQVVLNDQRFVLFQVDHEDEVIWAWVTVKNGFGYGFTCGCEINPDAGAAQRGLCQIMANTFQVK